MSEYLNLECGGNGYLVRLFADANHRNAIARPMIAGFRVAGNLGEASPRPLFDFDFG